MKHVLLASLLALPFLTLPPSVEAGGKRWRRDYTTEKLNGMIPGTHLGPWYLYWPYDAHFQSPAPTGYFTSPAPMTLPPAMYGLDGFGYQRMPQAPPSLPPPPPAGK